MNWKLVFLCAFSLCMGMFIDRILVNFPFLTLDPKVNVVDLAGLIVGVVIAFLIPFSVSKLIEDKRGIKTFLIDEIQDLIKTAAKVKSIICDAHNEGSFTKKDRRKILYIFHEAELKVHSINEQVKEAFEKEAESTKQTLIGLLFQYDRDITGGELVFDHFTEVDERFYKESNTNYFKIETGLKRLLQKVYKF